MTLVGAVVRHKTERGTKLDVARIKRDCKITQQPDGRSRPIHESERGRERGENQSEERTAVRTGRGRSTAESHAGLDGDDVPHGLLGRNGGLGSVPLQRDGRGRLRGRSSFDLMRGSRGRSRDWSGRCRLSRPLSRVLAESDRKLALTHLIHTTTNTLHQPLGASKHLFKTRLLLAEVHEVFLEFSM
jgi:hypothetical protein